MAPSVCLDEFLKTFPLRFTMRFLPLLLNIVLGNVASAKENVGKDQKFGKEEIKSSLLTDDIIVYIE